MLRVPGIGAACIQPVSTWDKAGDDGFNGGVATRAFAAKSSIPSRRPRSSSVSCGASTIPPPRSALSYGRTAPAVITAILSLLIGKSLRPMAFDQLIRLNAATEAFGPILGAMHT